MSVPRFDLLTVRCRNSSWRHGYGMGSPMEISKPLNCRWFRSRRSTSWVSCCSWTRSGSELSPSLRWRRYWRETMWVLPPWPFVIGCGPSSAECRCPSRPRSTWRKRTSRNGQYEVEVQATVWICARLVFTVHSSIERVWNGWTCREPTCPRLAYAKRYLST